MQSVDIKAQTTQQDNQSCKFTISCEISRETVDYLNSAEASRSPLANKIFGFPWTASVQIAPKHVIVTKQDWVDWDVLSDPLSGLIREHIERQLSNAENAGEDWKIEENPKIVQPKAKSPQEQKVMSILDNDINPSVATHGGHISFIGIKDDIVYVRMEGGCQGCAMSKATLKDGVKTAIQDALPEIKDVVDVTDHASGQNPFY